MSIKALCLSCSFPFESEERYQGTKVKCPRCGGLVHVPGEKQPDLPAWAWVSIGLAGVLAGGIGFVALNAFSRQSAEKTAPSLKAGNLQQTGTSSGRK